MMQDFEYLKQAGIKVSLDSDIRGDKIVVTLRFGGVFGTFIGHRIEGLGYQFNEIGNSEVLSTALTIFGALRLAYTKHFRIKERLQYAQTNGLSIKAVFV